MLPVYQHNKLSQTFALRFEYADCVIRSAARVTAEYAGMCVRTFTGLYSRRVRDSQLPENITV